MIYFKPIDDNQGIATETAVSNKDVFKVSLCEVDDIMLFGAWRVAGQLL